MPLSQYLFVIDV